MGNQQPSSEQEKVQRLSFMEYTSSGVEVQSNQLKLVGDIVYAPKKLGG